MSSEYLDTSKENLKQAYQKCLDQNTLTDEFSLLAVDVAKANLYRRKYSDATEIHQTALYRFKIRLVKNWKSINVDGNINSYLCGKISYALLDAKREYAGVLAKKEKLREYIDHTLHLLEESQNDYLKLSNRNCHEETPTEQTDD